MHAAIAKREHDDSSFVGQVLMRSSPVLTWRPAVVETLEREKSSRPSLGDGADLRRVPFESSVRLSRSSRPSRPSRAPTRRMVAWPLVAKVVHHTRSDRMARLALRAGSAIFAGGVLGLLVLFAIGPLLGRAPRATSAVSASSATVSVTHVTSATVPAAPASMPPSSMKVNAVHVSGDPIDTLAVPPPVDVGDDAANEADDAPATSPVVAARAKPPAKRTIAKPKGAPRATAHPHPHRRVPARGHR